jgi:hypothetical protein
MSSNNAQQTKGAIYESFNVDFTSTLEFDVLKGFPANENFKLNCWRAKDPVRPSRDIAIMINGFLDGVHHDPRVRKVKFLTRYELIAQRLAKQNISSVLMPMPFHFDRCADISVDGRFAPIERLKENGSFLYFGGYTQVINDVDRLIQMIKEEPSKFGLPDDDPNIHLIGYSLGGVAATGCTLELKHKYKFRSLTVYLSAMNISMIDPDSIERVFNEEFEFGFGRTEWENMLAELKRYDTNEVFEHLVWGKGEKPDLESSVERILFIHGLRDIIFDSNFSNSLTSELIGDHGYKNATYILMPTDHTASSTMKTISSYISSFISQV